MMLSPITLVRPLEPCSYYKRHSRSIIYLSHGKGIVWTIVNKQLRGLDPELTEAIIGTLHVPIVVLDENLRVIAASRAFYDTFQVEFQGIDGKLFYELGNGEWDIPQLRTLLEEIIPHKSVVEGYEVEHNFLRLGTRVMVINAREVISDNNQRKLLLEISDTTDINKIRRDKERLMLQKDTLLKEMRHRIANSLQLIASIILLKAGTVESEESRKHLEDAHDRIISIATVQRNLDPTTEDSQVPVVGYLKILCESLTNSMISGRKPITISVSGGAGVVTSDEAISLGLITTELVINALKHAFPSGEGAISVNFDSSANGWTLNISDDGIGLDATNWARHGGLGTNIVSSLAAQLEAEVKRESTPRGTVVSIIHNKTTPQKTLAV